MHNLKVYTLHSLYSLHSGPMILCLYSVLGYVKVSTTVSMHLTYQADAHCMLLFVTTTILADGEFSTS